MINLLHLVELATKQEILFLLPEDQIEEVGGKRNTLLEKIFITRNLQDRYALGLLRGERGL